MTKTFCKDCAYWEDHENGKGACHFWPPAQQDSPLLPDYFPRTNPDDWCFQGAGKDKILLENQEA